MLNMFISIVGLQLKCPPPKNYKQLEKKTTRRIAQRVVFRLFVLLGSEPSVGVGHPDVELLGPLHDALALPRGDRVGNFRRVHAVLHQQNLQIRHVVHQEFLESIGANVFGGLVATITNVGHLVLPLETTTYPIVNALGFSPVGLDAKEVF